MENATSLWDISIPDDDTESIAYIFGNELIEVDDHVLHEYDGIISACQHVASKNCSML